MEERILRYTDIDTRRAMGLPPRRLPPSDLVFPLGKISVRIEPVFAIVSVSFEDAGIHWYKITTYDDQYDHDAVCVWLFNQSSGIYHIDSGREYRMEYKKNGCCAILTKRPTEYCHIMDAGMQFRLYKTIGGTWGVRTWGWHPDYSSHADVLITG